MKDTKRARLRQRKQPVQARSEITVDALLEASVQVLLAVGYRKLTTTRVAERAGVSVGTLYQYFPNRESLIVAVIERYLREILSSVEQACQILRHSSLDDLANGLVEAFISAKWKRVELSRAMHEPLVDLSAVELVRAAAENAAGCVADVVRSCNDASFREEQPLALLIVMACSSLLQTAIADERKGLDVVSLRVHMRALVVGYLREMSVPRGSEPSVDRSPTAETTSDGVGLPRPMTRT